MSTHYSTIISAIDSVIAGISAVKAHYTYAPQEMGTYPAVTIEPVGHVDNFLSLRDTKRDYTFKIRVWGQLDNTRTDTQTVVRDLVDTIIDTLGLQSNLTLGGVVEWSNLTEANFVYVQKESSFFVGEITYKARVTYSRG